jgi:hypothetical protein
VIISPELRFQHFWARRYASAVVPATRCLLQNPEPILRAALANRRTRDLSRINVAATANRLGKFYERVAKARVLI